MRWAADLHQDKGSFEHHNTNIPGAHKMLGTWEGEWDLPWHILGFKDFHFQLVSLGA